MGEQYEGFIVRITIYQLRIRILESPTEYSTDPQISINHVISHLLVRSKNNFYCLVTPPICLSILHVPIIIKFPDCLAENFDRMYGSKRQN